MSEKPIEGEDSITLEVGVFDLMRALDALEKFAPGIEDNEWHQRLSTAVDLHAIDRYAPPGAVGRH